MGVILAAALLGLSRIRSSNSEPAVMAAPVEPVRQWPGEVIPPTPSTSRPAWEIPVMLGSGGRGTYVEPPRFKELRACETGHRCPEGSMCARSLDTGAVGCFKSNCLGASDVKSCAPGDACTLVGSGVFRCSPGGFVKRGGRCLDFRFANVEQRCEPGLTCVAGQCSQFCERDAACEAPARCIPTSSRPACVAPGALCTANAECDSPAVCLEGVCTTAGRPNGCVPGGCPDSGLCLGELFGSQFFGRCYTPCSADAPCAQGEVCASSGYQRDLDPPVCRKPCGVVSGTIDCGELERCGMRAETGEGVCSSRPPFDRSGNMQSEQHEVFGGPPDLPL